MVLLSLITISRFEMTDVQKIVKKPSKYARLDNVFSKESSISFEEYSAIRKIKFNEIKASASIQKEEMQLAIPEHAVEYLQNKYCPPGIGERVIADFD